MKTIGLIGGMTSESSREYYRIINEAVRDKLGGNHSAESVMVSVDFAPVETLMETGQWRELLEVLAYAAGRVESAGADFLLLCTNTMHKLADEIQARIQIPILNLIDLTADEIKKREMNTVGLLGTRFTMEEDFYKGRLREMHGFVALVPSPDERQLVHRVITEELSVGKLREQSRKSYWEIINHLAQNGAEGVILGCTEIPLLVREQDGKIPLFDTTYLHSTKAVELALESCPVVSLSQDQDL